MQIAWAEEGPSRTTLADAFASVIHRAHRTIRLSSPYFMPPPCILDALRIASRRGVRVAVMIPTCSDSRITDLASESYAADLLEAGKLFVSDVKIQWMCLHCGYVADASIAPEICPVCRHPQGWFIRMELAPFA